jgi:hypothetical protein
VPSQTVRYQRRGAHRYAGHQFRGFTCIRSQRSAHYRHFNMYPFPSCTSISISGATCSGKTTWLYRLLRHKDEMFAAPSPERVLYCYGIYQPLYDDMERIHSFITFHRGLPSEEDLEQLSSDTHCNLVVLDDLMDSVTSSSEMENLFVKGMHHRRLSIIYLNQNLFSKGKNARTINLNTHIQVLMKNPRDISQLQCLARQAFLGKSGYVMEAFKDATSESYGYLILDLSPMAEDAYRVRTRIFPEEDTIVYQSV